MPQTIANIPRCLPQILPVPGVLVSFLELGKKTVLPLGGRRQPLKKPSQSQKGHFYVKMNALNDTKTSELSKSAEGNGEYLWSSVAFVEAWIKSKSPNGKTGLKTTQILHKNKAWFRPHRDDASQLYYSVFKNFSVFFSHTCWRTASKKQIWDAWNSCNFFSGPISCEEWA